MPAKMFTSYSLVALGVVVRRYHLAFHDTKRHRVLASGRSLGYIHETEELRFTSPEKIAKVDLHLSPED